MEGLLAPSPMLGSPQSWLQGAAPDPSSQSLLKSIPGDVATELMHGPGARAVMPEYDPGIARPPPPDAEEFARFTPGAMDKAPGRQAGLGLNINDFLLNPATRKVAGVAAGTPWPQTLQQAREQFFVPGPMRPGQEFLSVASNVLGGLGAGGRLPGQVPRQKPLQGEILPPGAKTPFDEPIGAAGADVRAFNAWAKTLASPPPRGQAQLALPASAQPAQTWHGLTVAETMKLLQEDGSLSAPGLKGYLTGAPKEFSNAVLDAWQKMPAREARESRLLDPRTITPDEWANDFNMTGLKTQASQNYVMTQWGNLSPEVQAKVFPRLNQELKDFGLQPGARTTLDSPWTGSSKLTDLKDLFLKKDPTFQEADKASWGYLNPAQKAALLPHLDAATKQHLGIIEHHGRSPQETAALIGNKSLTQGEVKNYLEGASPQFVKETADYYSQVYGGTGGIFNASGKGQPTAPSAAATAAADKLKLHYGNWEDDAAVALWKGLSPEIKAQVKPLLNKYDTHILEKYAVDDGATFGQSLQSGPPKSYKEIAKFINQEPGQAKDIWKYLSPTEKNEVGPLLSADANLKLFAPASSAPAASRKPKLDAYEQKALKNLMEMTPANAKLYYEGLGPFTKQSLQPHLPPDFFTYTGLTKPGTVPGGPPVAPKSMAISMAHGLEFLGDNMKSPGAVKQLKLVADDINKAAANWTGSPADFVKTNWKGLMPKTQTELLSMLNPEAKQLITGTQPGWSALEAAWPPGGTIGPGALRPGGGQDKWGPVDWSNMTRAPAQDPFVFSNWIRDTQPGRTAGIEAKGHEAIARAGDKGISAIDMLAEGFQSKWARRVPENMEKLLSRPVEPEPGPSLTEPKPRKTVRDLYAERSGYTTPAYRGMSRSERDNPSFVLSPERFHATDNPKLAELYSGRKGVRPLRLNTEHYLVRDAQGAQIDDVRRQAINLARDQGRPGVTIHNVWDEPSPSSRDLPTPNTVYIPFDPKTARMADAPFGPGDPQAGPERTAPWKLKSPTGASALRGSPGEPVATPGYRSMDYENKIAAYLRTGENMFNPQSYRGLLPAIRELETGDVFKGGQSGEGFGELLNPDYARIKKGTGGGKGIPLRDLQDPGSKYELGYATDKNEFMPYRDAHGDLPSVYHASPALWEPRPGAPLGAYDPAKSGTGEATMWQRGDRGELAGHGFYVSEAEPVMQSYHDQFTARGDTPHRYELASRADPKRMIELDKPLSGQPEFTRRTLERVARALDMGPLHKDMTGRELYFAVSDRLGKGDRQLGNREASKLLSSVGIHGNRYLDAHSRAKGSGTSNMVLFGQPTAAGERDFMADVIKRYMLPGMLGGGLALGSLDSEPRQ